MDVMFSARIDNRDKKVDVCRVEGKLTNKLFTFPNKAGTSFSRISLDTLVQGSWRAPASSTYWGYTKLEALLSLAFAMEKMEEKARTDISNSLSRQEMVLVAMRGDDLCVD